MRLSNEPSNWRHASPSTNAIWATARVASLETPHLEALEKLAKDGARLFVGDRIELHFALAKAYEDLAGMRRRSANGWTAMP